MQIIPEKTAAIVLAKRVFSRSWIGYAALALGLLYIVFLFTHRLEAYPAPWHEDGAYLKVAKNYALNGVYANFSHADGDRYNGPLVSLGPTVILPIAWAFKIFGVSYTVGRLVIVLFTFAMLVTLFLLCAKLQDKRLAAVVVALTILAPPIDLIYYGRNIFGEVPGKFFLFSALLLWFNVEKPRVLLLALVGLLLGMCVITKNQYALFVLPTLALAWVADMLWYRRRHWLHFVVPGIVAGAVYFGWTYYVTYLIGAGSRDVANDVAELRAAIGTGFNFSITNMRENAELLLANGAYILIVPAFIFGLFISLRRDDVGQRWGILYLLFVFSTIAYVLSVGWERYTFPVMVLSAVFTVRLLYGMTNGFAFDWHGLSMLVRGKEPPPSAYSSIVTVGFFVAAIGIPFVQVSHAVRTHGDHHAYQLADYLQANVPQHAVIATWQEELAVLTDHKYHYPPQLMETIRNMRSANPNDPTYRERKYNFNDFVDAAYVILGHFSRSMQKDSIAYLPEHMADYELIHSIGQYEIYQKKR